MKDRLRTLSATLPLFAALLLWEILGRLESLPGRTFLPPLSQLIKEMFVLLESGVLADSFFRSLFRVVIGFSGGSLCGLGAGILMGWKSKLNWVFGPFISLVYPIPALGWLPVMMLLVGINDMLPITIIFICSFFPVCYNTVSGIRQVEQKYIWAARTLGASEFMILRKIVIPLAVPSIFTGFRLESGMAWRVVITAEMVAVPTGIGALMMRAESLIRMDIIIVCLCVLSVMCFCFEKFFGYVERRLTWKWK